MYGAKTYRRIEELELDGLAEDALDERFDRGEELEGEGVENEAFAEVGLGTVADEYQNPSFGVRNLDDERDHVGCRKLQRRRGVLVRDVLSVGVETIEL